MIKITLRRCGCGRERFVAQREVVLSPSGSQRTFASDWVNSVTAAQKHQEQ